MEDKPIYKKVPRKKKVLAKKSGDIVAKGILDGFDKETRIVGLTNGAFSLISLISEVLKITGAAKVTLSTWSAGFYDIGAFNDLRNSGLMTDVRIVIDYSFGTRLKQYATHLLEVFDEEQIRTTKNHSKFVLIQNDKWKIVILSSMNLNENIRSENFDISNEPIVFDMLNSFVDDLFKVRAKGLLDKGRDAEDCLNEILTNEKKITQNENNPTGFDFDFNVNFDFDLKF